MHSSGVIASFDDCNSKVCHYTETTIIRPNDRRRQSLMQLLHGKYTNLCSVSRRQHQGTFHDENAPIYQVDGGQNYQNFNKPQIFHRQQVICNMYVCLCVCARCYCVAFSLYSRLHRHLYKSQ